jgi:hypothetical protein
LRVAEGEEKGTRRRGIKWATLSLEEHKFRDMVLQVAGWRHVDDLTVKKKITVEKTKEVDISGRTV